MMRDTRQLSGHPCNPPIEVHVILSAASAKRSEALAKSKDPYHNDGTSMSEGVLAPRRDSLRQNSHPLPHRLQHLQRPLQLILRMRSRHDRANTRFAFGHSRKRDPGTKHPFFK